MILEYCCGGDLAQAMTRRRQEPLEEALARALIKQLASGIFCFLSEHVFSVPNIAVFSIPCRPPLHSMSTMWTAPISSAT